MSTAVESPKLDISRSFSADPDYTPPQTSTPSSPSSRTPSPEPELNTTTTSKKKKKKRAKKVAKKPSIVERSESKQIDRPPVLCISRNKHWKFISSYHGPWLQLPLELLDSLLAINMDPTTMSARETKLSPLKGLPPPMNRLREHKFPPRKDSYPPPEPPNNIQDPVPITHHVFPFDAVRPKPPPIDPGVFRSVTTIRRLIDEAAELCVRAASGLSAVALGSMRGGGSLNVNSSPWAAAQALGLSPTGEQPGGGRNVPMSANRIHRLRVLAIQNLAKAYSADEIASSVMVMQGGSVFEDIAEKVLKFEPHNVDALYVHFFHEKIPSRQLAESTTTALLDGLIAIQPQRLEFYRTRGIVHCFRDEYSLAVKDFTYALKETRHNRKSRVLHENMKDTVESRPRGKKKKSKINGQAPPNGTAPAGESGDSDQPQLHPSLLSTAPDPLEPQLLFHRGAAYLAHAIYLIETEIFRLEGISRTPMTDGVEFRLCYLDEGKYGGTEMNNPEGPLGRKDGAKLLAYRGILATSLFREHIYTLLRKSVRDHERFLSHFDTHEVPDDNSVQMSQKIALAFKLIEALRPGNHAPSPALPEAPLSFTTYHPLLVEAHFSTLICHLLLGDFQTLLPAFYRSAYLAAGLEGYPIFMAPRSMAQAEFVETLERLAGSWKTGTKFRNNSKHKLTIEAPPDLAPAKSTLAVDIEGASPSTSTPIGSTYDVDNFAASIPAKDVLLENLDCSRTLLAPVVTKLKERAEKAIAEKASGGDGRSPPISIPLHGPRVEILLAWLAAVHLPELDSVA